MAFCIFKMTLLFIPVELTFVFLQPIITCIHKFCGNPWFIEVKNQKNSNQPRRLVWSHLGEKGLEYYSGAIVSYSRLFSIRLVSFSFQNMLAPLTCALTVCFPPADLTAADMLLGKHCILPSPVALCIAVGHSWGARNKSLRYFPKYQITKNKY